MNWALLALVVAVAIGINLPFGAWRTTTRKLSWQWFLSIHLPIPAIFVIRRAAGFGWDYVPVMIACAVTGQILGGWLYARLRPKRVDRSGLGYDPFFDGHAPNAAPQPSDVAQKATSGPGDAGRGRLEVASALDPVPSLAAESERVTR